MTAPEPKSWPDWRYLYHGKVRHALRRTAVDGALASVAVCGTGPDWFDDWRGTGSQDERENLAARPACKRCVAKGARP